MIKKEERLVITFYATADAMAMEENCMSEQVEGRLIPVPGFISAGCGLAWSMKPEGREEIIAKMKKWDICPQEMHICKV
ncbi:MAG: DUF3343 domain-containing protein [Eubacterium sp.]|nr:DUF3343 domain-containing protein [Eubacterium sp.]